MATAISVGRGMVEVTRGVIEVEIGDQGQVWVNVNGRCRFRSQDAEILVLRDNRNAKRTPTADRRVHEEGGAGGSRDSSGTEPRS